MSENTEIKGFCPNCACVLYYQRAGETVLCSCCDCRVTPVATPGGAGRAEESPAEATVAGSFVPAVGFAFDSPESALVYLENFFENYDWSDYYESAKIFVEEIHEMVQTNKVKNGAQGQSWYLDFKALSIPLSKKLEGLAMLEGKIREKYDPEDSTEALAAFDTYRRVTAALVRERDAIVKQLTLDVQYAERFGLPAALVTSLKSDLGKIEATLAKVSAVKSINEVGAYIEAKRAIDEKKRAEFMARGVDAAAVYAEAVAKFDENATDNNEALALFETIRGYSDSIDYIKRINRYYNYHSELFHFSGKSYIYKAAAENPESKPATLKVSNPLVSPSVALELYEVVNGLPAEKPAVKDIDQIITNYGTRLYYFKRHGADAQIAVFDVTTGVETVIESGPAENYLLDGEDYSINFTRNGSSFFIKKRLTVTKKGCLASLFSKKKAEEPTNRDNNYSVVLVDMRTATPYVIIKELVDIADYFEDSLFYTVADPNAKKATPAEGAENAAPATCLMVCNLVTGQHSRVLDEACEIHEVTDGRVIYSLWKPNDYNRDLRVYDLRAAEAGRYTAEADYLIEDNILEYFTVDKRNGYIYYLVGNDDYCPLMRKNLDGTNRMEIMQNVENVVGVKGNWLYVVKGKGSNAILMKVSNDGARRILVCSQFQRVVKFTEDSLYYFDCWDRLHIVRLDGKGDRIIADGIAGWPIIAEDCIYYLRGEPVDDDKRAYSLYRMDLQGHNIKKIVFDVVKMQDYDESALYYSQHERLRYKVTIPQGKKAEPVVRYDYFTVKKYYALDKKSEKSTLVLTLGLPSGKTSFKGGCLGKKNVSADIIYEEAPLPRTFKRRGLAEAGENTAIATGVAAASGSTKKLVQGLGKKLGTLKSKARRTSGEKPSAFGMAMVALAVVLLVLTGIFRMSMGWINILLFVFASLGAALALGLPQKLLSSLPKLKKGTALAVLLAILAVLNLVFGIMFFVRNSDGSDGSDDVKGSSFSSAITLREGKITSASIEEKGQTVFYVFTASEDGEHTFLFENGAKITLYSSKQKELTSEKMSGSFEFTYSLKEGTKYYLEVGAYSSSKTGKVRFVVESSPALPGDSRDNAIAYTAGGVSGTTTNGSTTYYSFTPTVSGSYTFYTTGGTDTYGLLYDSLSGSAIAENDGGSDFSFAYTLTAGDTYYIAVKGYGSTSGSYTLYIEAPVGSNRDNAIAYTAGGMSGTTTNGSTTYYSFTPAVSGSYTFYTTSSIDTYGTLYSSVSGSSVSAADYGGTNGGDFGITYTLTAGNTYYIAVRGYSSSTSGSYTLYIEAPGDSRDNAIAYTEGGMSGAVANGSITYYSITPAVSGSYTFYTTGGTDTYGLLYDSLSGSAIAENDGGSDFSFTYTLTAGNTYYIAVRGYSSSTSGSYTLYIAAPGDSRDNAISYTEGGISGTTTNGSTTYYSFTPTVSGSYRFYTASSIDTYGTLYSSVSGSSVSTADYGGTNSGDFSITYTLTAGNTYYIAVSGYSSSTSGSYTFYVEAPAGSSRENPITVNYTDYGLGDTLAAGEIVYYAFTPSYTGTYYFYTVGSTDTYGQLYTSQTSSDYVYDDDSASGYNFSLSYYCYYGTTYYIAVKGSSSSTTGSYTFYVSTSSPSN